MLSGGRLVAGFPVGTPMDMNFAYGINPATVRDRYHEAHDLVIQAWTRPDVFAFNGKYMQLRYVNIWPQPLQKPHPPVWIPGRGSLETYELTAKLDDVYCYLSYFGYKRGRCSCCLSLSALGSRYGTRAPFFARSGWLKAAITCFSAFVVQSARGSKVLPAVSSESWTDGGISTTRPPEAIGRKPSGLCAPAHPARRSMPSNAAKDGQRDIG